MFIASTTSLLGADIFHVSCSLKYCVTVHRLLEEKTSMLEAQGAIAGAKSEVTELREEKAKLAGQVSLASHQLDTLRVSCV